MGKMENRWGAKLMALRPMYIVMFREKGLFVLEPVPGMTQSAAIEAALHTQGGYSAGLVEVEIPEGASEVWAAWVEGEGARGPYFMFRTLDGALTEAEAEAALKASGEEPLKLNRSLIYHPTDRPLANDEPAVQEFQAE
jgi:hypothetical protein